MNIREVDIINLEDTIWLGTKSIGVPAYDFTFEPLFSCRRPYQFPNEQNIIGRVGAFHDYQDAYKKFSELGFMLINNVEQHFLASELPEWYPVIEQYTPRSVWYEEVPSAKEVESNFDYPVFIKGARQTAKHKESLCVARNRKECEAILKEYQKNAILHWQQLVCREFLELEPIEAASTEKVSPSFEFRSFWYKNNLVGVGHYWSEFVQYSWNNEQEAEALRIASKVCDLLNVPFLVIDLALTKNGNWVVIECNDGQESGYAGINPISLWKNIVDIESEN
ncbi:DUF4343 domain-containing protein [Aliikangiella marina]|uniref:DUF4343 domain-containing protein n=1 Tax=Aliikangiella marina TaxID=1712262 RepID=A0A545TDG7_9GAMM|nr:ATP-grasp domain-containing protein [Aliikangiella marina]TQV75231.1 DUF4343 domain-containing protein [Aliikangiella marina]